jgi:uncharacterized cupin superfamily protein
MTERPIALRATEVPPRPRPSGYPADLAAKIAEREKRVLGDPFGLVNFGVNLTRLAPGAGSSIHHVHAKSDEWVYVLEGTPTLHVGDAARLLAPGDCAGFPAGGPPHHLVNHGDQDVVILEVGDRAAGDSVFYPEDDLAAAMQPDGTWRYTRKDGSPL